MAAAQLFLPASRAFNSNGLPVAGAVLKLYTTGTLIPQPIYSDSALTISLGSSVTANAAGRFQTVYQDNATAFRLRIEDATGAELDDIDPYYFGTMLFSATFSELASFTTRALLAAVSAPADKQFAYLTEAGREGEFVFSTANLSTKVTADPNQGLFVAPAADTTGASGAWVRKFTGSPHVNWWGAKGDYNGTTGTDNASVFAAVQTTIQAVAFPEPDLSPVWFVGRSLSFRDGGRYYTTAPLNIITAITEIDFTGSQIVVPADTKAIVVNSDTTNDEATRASGPFPYEITLIKPTCRGTIGTDRNKPLIWLRAKATIIQPDCEGASGDLIRIGGLNGHTAGNQDGWRIFGFKGQKCGGSGVHAEGADASVGLCDGYEINLCGRFAIKDLSAAGSEWHGQSADCGVLLAGVNSVPAFCYNPSNGHNWAIRADQEANAGLVAPSSARPDVWIDLGAGTGTDPAIATWVPDIVMEAGGSVCTLGGTAAAQFNKPYFESGPYSAYQLNINSIIRDPTGLTSGIGGAVEYTANGSIRNRSAYIVETTDATGTSSVQLGGNGIGGVNSWAEFTDSHGNSWKFDNAGNYGLRLWDNQVGQAALAVTAPGSGLNFGRSTDQPGTIWFNQMAIGVSNAGRIVDMNTAAPASGYHAQGEITFNSGVTAAGVADWRTVASGTPGTQLGNYVNARADPSTGIGYVTGAGGAVTQATSRTTGVTLNKVCGAITLFSAAGSATYATFTVTNSAVAATDVIRVVQKSGTDKYIILVTAVGAGSFEITFATTGGTTTEQPVFNFAVVKAVAA